MCYTKRPAVLLTVSYIGALGIGRLLCEAKLSLWLLAACAAVFLFVYAVLFDGKKHLFLSLLILVAIFYAGIQWYNENAVYTKWDALRGQTVTVEGVIKSVSYTSDGISYATAKITEVESEKTCVSLSLSMTGGVHLSEYEAFSGKIYVLTEEESSGYFEENQSYYRAHGIVGEAELRTEGLERLGTPRTLRGTFEEVRSKLCASLSRYVEYDELSFVSGMVFGDREAISASVARDFRRTGTSHLLAVSGTHLSVMIAGLYCICKKLRFGHVLTVAVLFVTVFFVVCVTGFPLSVVRAALMWCIGAVAFVFGGRRDGYSALALSVTVICACDMRAIYDIGLQMSVLSTLGILMLGPPTEKWLARRMPKHRISKYIREYAIMPIAFAITSTVFTLPVTFFSFGEISLIAPLANLLLAFPCAFLLFATPVLLLLACLPLQAPATLCAFFVFGTARLCMQVTNTLSELPNLLLGIKYFFVPIVCVLSCVFALLLYRKWKSPLVFYAAFLAGSILFLFCHGVYYHTIRDRVTVLYQMQGKNESVSIIQGNDAVLIDISNGAKGACYDAYLALSERQITEVEALILTHYDRKHDAMIASLFEKTVIRSIYLPKPTSEKDLEIYNAICSADYMDHAVCYEYDPSMQELSFADVSIVPSENMYLSRSDVPITVFSIEVGEECISYVSSAAWECENENGRAYLEAVLADTQYLICGSHGPKVKTEYGMRKNLLPYRLVSLPLKESALLFSHTVESCVIAEDTKNIKICLYREK